MRPARAIIDTQKLRNNYHTIKKKAPDSEVMAIVKANAYGHGITECSKTLEEEGCRYFGVAIPEEAIKLREAGIQGEILVIYPVLPDQAEYFCKYNLQASLCTIEFAEGLSNLCRDAEEAVKCHLFINTGMNRDGVQAEDAVNFMEKVSSLPGIEIIGAYTHFATSATDVDFARRQLGVFNKTIDNLKKAGYEFHFLHTANTGAVAHLPESYLNMIRPGIALYGGGPDEKTARVLGIEPIMTLKSKITLIRDIEAGDSVGYDRLFTADKKTRIATAGIGYADGYFKILTGKASCIVRGKKFPLAGSVCMDEIMIDIKDENFSLGEDVTLIGTDGGESISQYELARLTGSIPYEITTAVSPRVERIYI